MYIGKLPERSVSPLLFTKGDIVETKLDRVMSTIKRRLGRALIWPVLLLQYDLNSDHTLGGYKARWLLWANRKFDKLLRRWDRMLDNWLRRRRRRRA